MNGNGYTPTERRLMEVLKDGNRHLPDELQSCLNDELSGKNNLEVHICNLRKKVRPLGQGILCESAERRCFYRLVRFISLGE